MKKQPQGHCIIPPTDKKLRQQLDLKLKEYQARKAEKINEHQYPGLSHYPELSHMLNRDYRDTCYKIHVLEAVLKNSEPVDTWKLSQEMHEQWKDVFNVDDFCVACGVIAKYCGDLSNQSLLAGGTGLPELLETK